MDKSELLDVLLAVGGFALGLITTLFGGLTWFIARDRDRTKKAYAAERDFGHLKTAYQQLAHNQEVLLKEGDERNDAYLREFLEIKNLINIILVRLQKDESFGQPRSPRG